MSIVRFYTAARRSRAAHHTGAALMPVILVFAALVVVVGLAFAAISISHSIAVESEYGSSRALHYAEAGLNDALMRLTRERDYLCPTIDCYSIEFASNGCTGMTACAWVTIKEGASTTHERILVSHGRSGVNERILERSFFFDNSLNGLVSGVTWCERDDDAAVSPLCPFAP